VELKSNVFLDMSYFKGKLQNVNIRYNSNWKYMKKSILSKIKSLFNNNEKQRKN
jgi:hypothetical protein